MEQNVVQLAVLERLWAWFETNKKQVLTGAGIVVVVGGVVSFYVWHQGEKEAGASEALSNPLAPLLLPGGARNQTADAYLKVATEHRGTAAAGRAILQAGALLFTQGKYAEAQAQFERFLREYPENLFGAQAQFGVAACLEAQGKTDLAAQNYRLLAERRSTENVVPQAKFALAGIYESQNKFSEANSLYEDVARSDPSSSLGSEAALRAEELRSKLPAPAPAPVPAPAPGLIPVPATSGTNAKAP